MVLGFHFLFVAGEGDHHLRGAAAHQAAQPGALLLGAIDPEGQGLKIEEYIQIYILLVLANSRKFANIVTKCEDVLQK